MKKLSLILLLPLLAIQANAQIFWKVTPPEANSRPSYIFGTHHGAPASVADRFGVSEYFSVVDTVYGEISPDDISSADNILSYMIAPADSTLNKVFTPEELEEIDRAMTDITGQPGVMYMVMSMKPGAISTMIMQTMLQKEIPDFDITKQLDMTILSNATAAGKPVKGLETIERQMRALYCTPISHQAKELLKDIREENYGIDKLHKMTDAYMANDLNGIDEICNEEKEADNPSHIELVDKRNSEWVNFLLGLLPTTSALIVVGAGHLPGNTGLLNSLRSAGYKLEPISPKN